MNPQLQAMLQQAIQAFQDGNFDVASSILKATLQADISNADTIFDLGVACAEANRLTEALIIFYCLQPYKNSDGTILYNLGLIYSLQGKHQLALDAYELALKIQPDDIATLINKGAIHNQMKDFSLALEALDYAIQINQNYHEAYSNKANALSGLKRYDEALINHDKALILQPDFADGYVNKANTLIELKRYDESIACYEKALTLNTSIDYVPDILFHTKMKICSWSDFKNSLEDISKRVMVGERVIQPFPLLSLLDDASLHKQASEIFARNKYPENPILGPIPKHPKKEKIRIGYFSADFKNHAVSILTAELFELHDKDRFEIIAFSFGVDDKSPIRSRLSQAFSQFIDVRGMSDLDIAKLSRELRVDIAVDLSGYTSDNRTGIFSYRAAPIQVNWLGYPGTIGANFMDYIVADKTIIPAQSEQFYTEKVVSLPDTYIVDDSKRLASSRVFTRAELGLPENVFVFCCFNNDYKFNPQVLDAWARILLQVKNSVVWISENNQSFKGNITAEFNQRGIDSSRVIFAQRQDLMADHLARYALADLFLDTCPYNAHTTALDSLKAGIPVLTLMGQSFASRVAASLLRAVGLPELIANTWEEYEALAIELAMSPQKLAQMKSRLADNRMTAPLFNTPLFTKNLETAYSKMYERYQADLPVDHISI
jgi:predicted O-linked N-acetylglucosamine transferase (SPINDLY family)